MAPDMLSFAKPADFAAWLAKNHTASELFIRFHKVKSGTPSITWEQAVIEALCWGWIDGVKRSLGPDAFVQRFTPRAARSGWSKRNCNHVERLIAEGRMQPPGLVQVEAAKADGRWDAAYVGQAEMEIPADFLTALDAGPPAARAQFDTLNRQNLFAIYCRLTTAKRPETRAKRIVDFVALLARGETFH